jgi:hypothetical protein
MTQQRDKEGKHSKKQKREQEEAALRSEQRSLAALRTSTSMRIAVAAWQEEEKVPEERKGKPIDMKDRDWGVERRTRSHAVTKHKGDETQHDDDHRCGGSRAGRGIFDQYGTAGSAALIDVGDGACRRIATGGMSLAAKRVGNRVGGGRGERHSDGRL